MIRDFNIIRTILLQVEAAPPSAEPLQTLQFDEDIEATVVGLHIELMIDGGLLDADVISINPLCFVIHKITWIGHDFLQNARNDNIWKKVMSQAKDKGTSMTLVILNGLLTKAAEKYAGFA